MGKILRYSTIAVWLGFTSVMLYEVAEPYLLGEQIAAVRVPSERIPVPPERC